MKISIVAQLVYAFLIIFTSMCGRPVLASVYNIDPDTASIDLNDGLEYRLVSESNISTKANTPDEWITHQTDTLNLAGTEQPVWVRFRLSVGNITDTSWFLRVHWPTLQSVSLLLIDPRTDEIIYQSNWPENQTNGIDLLPAAIPLSLDAHRDVIVVLKIDSPDMLVTPISLYREDTYQQWVHWRNLSIGLFFGALLAMLFYNMSLYIFLKDASYAVYCFYVLSIMAYVVMMTGLGKAYLWPDSPGFNSRAYGFFASMAFLAAACFIRTFLTLPKYGGLLLMQGNAAVFFWVFIGLLHLIFASPLSLKLVHAMGIVSCCVGFGVSAYLWVKGNVSAKYMTIAWGPLIGATFVLMLGLNGVISYGVWQNYLQNIGFVIEVILLSMALAERINRERQQKLAAQAMSLRHSLEASSARERELKAQARILDIEREARAELENKVAERTHALEDALSSLESANKELSLLSRTDALTQLSNRRKFDEQLVAEVNRCARFKQPLALMMIDIDYFKRINDTYGHTAGDECLKAVARVIQNNASRTDDLAARYGGEEFCVLMVGTDAESATEIAETIRSDVEKAFCAYGDFEIRFTVSVGLFWGVPTIGLEPATLINMADNELYLAKKNGRNRVEVMSY